MWSGKVNIAVGEFVVGELAIVGDFQYSPLEVFHAHQVGKYEMQSL